MKQLILTGDDFGHSHAINESIERHHQAGLLTQASLMVNEPCVDEAVGIARRNPALCIGLHLTLCAGSASRVSAITDARGALFASPGLAGLRYAFDPRTAEPLEREIGEQFRRFQQLGFPPSYLDGHTHLHLHPAILRRMRGHLISDGFTFVRLVREPGNFSPIALIFRVLSAVAQRGLKRHRIAGADRVYGLRDTGRMTTTRFAELVEHLPDGVSELYFHPGAEPAALDLPLLRRAIDDRAIALVSAATLRPRQSAE